MDEMLKQSLSDATNVISISLTDSIIGMLMSVAISFILSYIYMKTHSGYSYSRNYIFSLILISLTISLIMTIIGSNIARAFALVGAMSIVRFRNPIKETRDLAYIFMSIAIGMACGTGFYIYSIVFLIFIILVEMFFKSTNYGKYNQNNFILSFEFETKNFDRLYKEIENVFDKISIISKESFDGDNIKTLIVVSVKLKKNESIKNLINSIDKRDNFYKVSVLSGNENIEN
tara:strand:+ start:625 stop:1317 length:693 start_codon:yes stop_codon:yes gene_type:complete